MEMGYNDVETGKRRDEAQGGCSVGTGLALLVFVACLVIGGFMIKDAGSSSSSQGGASPPSPPSAVTTTPEWLVLDGSQAAAAAKKCVYCIQRKDWKCLEDLFDPDMTYLVAGYLPPGKTPQVPMCKQYGPSGGAAAFITHIKAWMSSWANAYTYFGPWKFDVKSYDSVSWTSSVNWFLEPAGSDGAPAFASDVTFMVSVTPDGKRIKSWVELANVESAMTAQANSTDMRKVITDASAGYAAKNAATVTAPFADGFTATVYLDGATTAPTTYTKAQFSTAITNSIQTQSHATYQNQLLHATCGFTYGRFVYMKNSATGTDRCVVEGTRWQIMNTDKKVIMSKEFLKPNLPANGVNVSQATVPETCLYAPPVPETAAPLDGSQAAAAAKKCVYCIQRKDWKCLEDLFDPDMTYLVAGYLPPGTTPQVPMCKQYGPSGGAAAFITHIKAWMSSWANAYTYFGPWKFDVKSYDSVSWTSSVNWFLEPGGSDGAPAFASDVTFMVSVTPDGKRIKSWVELANVESAMKNQTNSTAMRKVITDASAGYAAKNAATVTAPFADGFTATVYLDGATTAPTTYTKAQFSTAITNSIQTQSHATYQNQLLHATCGFTYGRFVYMKNSATGTDRCVVEGTRWQIMNTDKKVTMSKEFLKTNEPKSGVGVSEASNPKVPLNCMYP